MRETAEILHSDVDGTLVVANLILVVGRLRYRGKGSGVETDDAIGYLVRTRNGRIRFLLAFREPEAVLGTLATASPRA